MKTIIENARADAETYEAEAAKIRERGNFVLALQYERAAKRRRELVKRLEDHGCPEPEGVSQ